VVSIGVVEPISDVGDIEVDVELVYSPDVRTDDVDDLRPSGVRNAVARVVLTDETDVWDSVVAVVGDGTAAELSEVVDDDKLAAMRLIEEVAAIGDTWKPEIGELIDSEVKAGKVDVSIADIYSIDVLEIDIAVDEEGAVSVGIVADVVDSVNAMETSLAVL
jgi:hypothetical protein